jgi:hypothetical protein
MRLIIVFVARVSSVRIFMAHFLAGRLGCGRRRGDEEEGENRLLDQEDRTMSTDRLGERSVIGVTNISPGTRGRVSSV